MQDALGLSNTQNNQSAEARMQPASTSTSLMPDAATSAAEAGLWLQFLAKLTGQAVDRLPQVWQLVQVSRSLHCACCSCCSHAVSLIAFVMSALASTSACGQ